MKLLYIVVLLGLVSGCGYNSFEGVKPATEEPPVPNMTIGTLRATYRGQPIRVTNERVVVSGYVTTNDRSNNFYRSLWVEDETGAVEVKVGLYNSHLLYPIGQRVVIKPHGLMLGMVDGLLQLGMEGPSSIYPIDYMAHRVVVDTYLFSVKESRVNQPRTVDLGALQEEWVGMLVRVENLFLDPQVDTTWALSAKNAPTGIPQSACLKFRSVHNPEDSIHVVTSGYAHFASERVPRGRVSLTGILLRGKVASNMVVQLKIRDEDDVQCIPNAPLSAFRISGGVRLQDKMGGR